MGFCGRINVFEQLEVFGDFFGCSGQAAPKTVVGILWFSRRAVVVGEPLQVEPVMTVPARRIALYRPASVSRLSVVER